MRKRGNSKAEIGEALMGSFTSWPGQPHPVHGQTLWKRGQTADGRKLKILAKKDDESYIITVADVASEI